MPDINLSKVELELSVSRIANVIVQKFENLICMEDVNVSDTIRYTEKFISRGIASLALSGCASITPEISASALSDGFDDGGIDAVFFDRNRNRIYFIQSKLVKKGNASPAQGDVMKFCSGVKKLINLEYNIFGESIKKHKKDIDDAINGFGVKVVLIIAYSGSEPLSKHALDEFNEIKKFISEENFEIIVSNKSDLEDYAKWLTEEKGINSNINLIEWGNINHPYAAYYGQIDISQIYQLYSAHGNRLFHKNIRSFMQDSDLNNKIRSSIDGSPDDFWYMNNGITAICSSITKALHGGGSKSSGTFDVCGMSVVNGAQTIGNMARAWEEAKKNNNTNNIENVKVFIKIINTNNNDELADKITRSTNSQNRVNGSDFASLDKNQIRIRTDLIMLGVDYVYRSGEKVTNPEKGFDILEAVVALACFHNDISYSVRSKSGIGSFFEDTTKGPYKEIFNDNTDAAHLWRLVRIMRAVENCLVKERETAESKENLILQHGNRFILRLFMQHHRNSIEDNSNKIEMFTADVGSYVKSAVKKVSDINSDLFPNTYTANTFKNVSRCSDLEKKFLDTN